MADEEEREHPATARQRQRFAERGEVVNARELINALVLASCGVVVVYTAHSGGLNLVHAMRRCFNNLDIAPNITLWTTMAMVYWNTVKPLFLTVIAVSIIASIAKARGVVYFKPPSFDLNRINPINRLMSLFTSKQTLGTLGMACVKMMLVVAVCGWVLFGRVPGLLQHVPVSLAGAGRDAFTLIKAIFVRGTLILLMLGTLEYIRSYYALEKRMSMSAQMLRDEMKDQMGDPAARNRIRSRAREIMRKRMLNLVPKADVVLVNPTHFAVALLWESTKMVAPVVVAKGADAWAERIRAVARKHSVPVVPQPTLTRMLYRQVDVGKPVPEDLYQAVAVVLSHVYRLRRRVG